MSEPIVHTIPASAVGRFLVRLPVEESARPPVLIGFHGYGENAERHLAELERIPGLDAWLLVAVMGLHRFYQSRTDSVVASWMTRLDREQSIEDNLRYVDDVMSAVRSAYETSDKLVCAGFSQGVAMAYRAGVRGRRRCAGIIALAGDVPPELRTHQWSDGPAVLIGRGDRDEWYTSAKLDEDLAVLRSHGARVDHIVYDGAHAWTPGFCEAAARFVTALP